MDEPSRELETLVTTSSEFEAHTIGVMLHEAGIESFVIDMHGALSAPSDHERLSGMQVKAADEGFIVAQPAGILRSWDILTGNGEDVDFILAVVADVQARVAVDPDRIYATGMSNGGGMADRLGCVAPDVFAAIAPVAGWYVDAVDCRSDRRIPVLAFHGTADLVVPYNGGPFFVAIPEWAAAWAERNGCSPTPVDKQVHDDVQVRVWPDCDAEMELYTIDGGGHGWPGTEFELGKLVTTSSIDATDVIWEFFVGYRRASRTQ